MWTFSIIIIIINNNPCLKNIEYNTKYSRTEKASVNVGRNIWIGHPRRWRVGFDRQLVSEVALSATTTNRRLKTAPPRTRWPYWPVSDDWSDRWSSSLSSRFTTCLVCKLPLSVSTPPGGHLMINVQILMSLWSAAKWFLEVVGNFFLAFAYSSIYLLFC